MASHPPGACCTIGVKHEGEATGTMIKLDSGHDAYVAEPKGNTAHKDSAIIILPDVIGIWKNSQLLADQYAANGYYTVIVDTFRGDALPLNRGPDFDFVAWRGKHTEKEVDPTVEAGIRHLKGKGFKKIGGAGYCFGAKYVCRFLNGKGIDVGYSAHPSFITQEELAAIKGPYSISAAETDNIFTVDLRHKSEEILRKIKVPFQINLFSGVEHGFSVRCDPKIPIQKFAKEQAFLQAVAWFHQYLK